MYTVTYWATDHRVYNMSPHAFVTYFWVGDKNKIIPMAVKPSHQLSFNNMLYFALIN